VQLRRQHVIRSADLGPQGRIRQLPVKPVDRARNDGQLIASRPGLRTARCSRSRVDEDGVPKAPPP
jgi:hypothetical protein